MEKCLVLFFIKALQAILPNHVLLLTEVHCPNVCTGTGTSKAPPILGTVAESDPIRKASGECKQDSFSYPAMYQCRQAGLEGNSGGSISASLESSKPACERAPWSTAMLPHFNETIALCPQRKCICVHYSLGHCCFHFLCNKTVLSCPKSLSGSSVLMESVRPALCLSSLFPIKPNLWRLLLSVWGLENALPTQRCTHISDFSFWTHLSSLKLIKWLTQGQDQLRPALTVESRVPHLQSTRNLTCKSFPEAGGMDQHSPSILLYSPHRKSCVCGGAVHKEVILAASDLYVA